MALSHQDFHTVPALAINDQRRRILWPDGFASRLFYRFHYNSHRFSFKIDKTANCLPQRPV
jgi:hypothetical protein